MKLFINWLIYAIAIFITAYILPGVAVESFWVAIVTALILGIINAVIKPIIKLLTLPITILTLGIFALVINAFLVILASYIVPGFFVSNFLWALAFSLVLSIINWFINSLSGNKNH